MKFSLLIACLRLDRKGLGEYDERSEKKEGRL